MAREKLPTCTVRIDGNAAVMELEISGIRFKRTWLRTRSGFRTKESAASEDRFYKRLEKFADAATRDEAYQAIESLDSALTDMFRFMRDSAENLGLDIAEEIE